ncbi:DUF6033 family protein [Paenibacillus riograndensis]|uniref:Uncharacterized protein n=2 Tax=Paenibacillus riograndensis TaxID=483937 RepID=A0A132TDJ4_9BACL|nr:DUF6033 family protein [Paenibacillus riograndensis]KWX69400.1 hypothetical protein AMQ84_30885 [Paenibacillus riograndensis]CQR58912.1 hypothetical protein PRIO_6565 [Paenibacillus riograndensis SBR5]
MYIPITGISGVSLTRPPQQPENHSSTPASALSFNETLAAVNAATMDQAERLKRKYGVRVRIQAVSKGGKELEHSGMSGDEREIIIAPNILQQMAKDPVMRNKVYGTLDPYVTQEQTSQNPLQPLKGGKGLNHSLIVHKDGSVALWSAAASPREAETGKHLDMENRNEQAEESRTAAERRHAWEAALPILSKNLLSAAEASLQGQEPAANPVDGVAAHDWLHQLQLVRARRSNKLL